MSITIPQVMPVIGIAIIKTNAGMVLRDAPMSQTDGALNIGTYRNGTVFYLYALLEISNVIYALVQHIKSPSVVGFLRVQEADGTNQNVQVLKFKE